MTKRLVVNADDFGMSPAVTRGILESHQGGIVTSTTVMIGMPGAVEAVRDAVMSAPELGLGLHITIAAGRCQPVLPAAQVPTLVREDGCFYDNPVWWQRYDSFNPDELQREIEAQCSRFIEAAGRPPDHLDSHYHSAYLHPAALRATFNLAARYDIPVRRAFGGAPSLEEGLKRIDSEPWRDALRRVFAELPMPRSTDRFIDLRPDMSPEQVITMLQAIPDHTTTEMLCHPGYVDSALESVDTYTTGRESEVRLLTNPAVSAAVQQFGIELIRFDSLD